MMQRSVYSTINKGLLLILLGHSQAEGVDLQSENIQVHGFAAQSLFHTSDNNLFGQSDDGISLGITEIGLNASYQPFSRLSFAVQGLYRRAGDIDRGSGRIDYGLADLTLWEHESGRVGVRGGRIKIPFGLYNESRDVPFLRPTILLPQGIYFERSRSLLTSADGGSFYLEQRSKYGDFFFKFNYASPLGNNKEIRSTLLSPAATGEFSAQPAIATQLSYEISGGEYIFAISHMDLKLDYHPNQNDRYQSGRSHIRPLMFSVQYNGEKLTLTGEYGYRWNTSKGYVVRPDNHNITESWYLQSSYQILPQWQATLRYDTVYADIDNRYGKGLEKFNLPSHIAFAQDWMVGLRWDINESWMLRGEYHRVHGTYWLPQADNPDRMQTVQDWDLFGLQTTFHF